MPSPFVSYASIPGSEAEYFVVYDVSGSMVARCKGNRIGDRLAPGVHLLVSENEKGKCLRAVKIR